MSKNNNPDLRRLFLVCLTMFAGFISQTGCESKYNGVTWKHYEYETVIKSLERQPLEEWFCNYDRTVFITELNNTNSAEEYVVVFEDGVIVRNRNVLKLREIQKKRIRALYQKIKKHIEKLHVGVHDRE